MPLVFSNVFYSAHDLCAMLWAHISVIVFSNHVDNEFGALCVLRQSDSVHFEQVDLPINFVFGNVEKMEVSDQNNPLLLKTEPVVFDYRTRQVDILCTHC